MVKTLQYVLVDRKLENQAKKIQKELFPLVSGENDIKTSINGKIATYYSLVKYYLVKIGRNYVGICGLYAYNDYPQDAWLGWFGVRERYRRRGFGLKILHFCAEEAKEMGFSNLRLETDNIENCAAVKLYTKFGMTKEVYSNKKDVHFEVGKTLIFSCNLDGKKVVPWKNKYLYLKEHDIINGTIKK